MPPKKSKTRAKKPQNTLSAAETNKIEVDEADPVISRSYLEAKVEREVLESFSEIVQSFLDTNFVHSNTTAAQSSITALSKLAFKQHKYFEKAFLEFLDRLITFDQDDSFLKILHKFLHLAYIEFMTPKFEPIGPNLIRAAIKHLVDIIQLPKI